MTEIDVNKEPATIGDVARLMALVTIQVVTRLSPDERGLNVLDDIGSALINQALSDDPRTNALLQEYAAQLIATEA